MRLTVKSDDQLAVSPWRPAGGGRAKRGSLGTAIHQVAHASLSWAVLLSLLCASFVAFSIGLISSRCHGVLSGIFHSRAASVEG